MGRDKKGREGWEGGEGEGKERRWKGIGRSRKGIQRNKYEGEGRWSEKRGIGRREGKRRMGREG